MPSLSSLTRDNGTKLELNLYAFKDIKDIQALVAEFETDTAVLEFSVRGRLRGDDAEETSKLIVGMLKGKGGISSLTFHDFTFDYGGVQELTSIIAGSGVKKLSLRSCPLDDAGIVMLAATLKTNTSLERLDLFDTGLNNKGAIAIADAVKENTTLLHLDLGRNRFFDKGATVLADMLKTNRTLKSLFLYPNFIEAEGFQKLAEALETNTSLNTLMVFHDPSSPALQFFTDALDINNTLTEMGLGDAAHGDPETQVLRNRLARNASASLSPSKRKKGFAP